MRRARDGSSEALGELAERYSGKLLALIRLRMGRLRDRMESRDVLQNTLVKALRGVESFDGEESGPLLAWLATIAHNEIRDLQDHHHAHRRRLDLEQGEVRLDDLEASVASMVSRIAMGERSRQLEVALLELPEAQREVVVLRAFEELSFGEIGERLGRELTDFSCFDEVTQRVDGEDDVRVASRIREVVGEVSGAEVFRLNVRGNEPEGGVVLEVKGDLPGDVDSS